MRLEKDFAADRVAFASRRRTRAGSLAYLSANLLIACRVCLGTASRTPVTITFVRRSVDTVETVNSLDIVVLLVPCHRWKFDATAAVGLPLTNAATTNVCLGRGWNFFTH
jgi:hypothetical protein